MSSVVAEQWPDDEGYHESTEYWGSTMISRFRKDRWQLFLEMSGRAPKPEISAGPLGHAFEHCLLEGGDKWSERFAVGPVGIRTRRGKAWEAFEAAARAEKKEPLLASEPEIVDQMVVSARKHKVLGPALDLDFTTQRGIRWTDPETGVKCKSLPDYERVGSHLIIDVKSISGRKDEAPQETVAKQIAKYGYHRQGAHYSAGHEQVHGVWPDFILAFVFKEPPFHTILVRLHEESAALGVRQVRAALAEIGDVLGRVEDEGEGAWRPPFSRSVNVVSLPGWAFNE